MKKTQPVSLGSGQKSPLDFSSQGEGIFAGCRSSDAGCCVCYRFPANRAVGTNMGRVLECMGGAGPEIAVQAGLGCVGERATREIGVTEQQRNANKSRNASYGSVRSERREEEKMKKRCGK